MKKHDTKNKQAGRALIYITGFLAIVFLGVVALGYIKSNGASIDANLSATSLFK